MPFAPFVGVTGHGDNCLFGCAILQNESAETFEWLFLTFLKCMGGKSPKTIITDQDAAMAKAIPAVFIHTVHRNCLFHVVKKAEEKHPRSFGKIPNLHNEFKDTIHFSLTVAEFEASWQEMIQKYEVGNLKYLKTMWENRKKFIPVYFKNDFFPFIHSTARSEGTNAVFKDNVGSTYSVSSFLTEYDKIA
jgi:transposase-like protein